MFKTLIDRNPTICGRINLIALNVSNNFRYKIIDLAIKRIKSDNSFKFKPSHVVYYCAMNNCFLYAENLVCIELKCTTHIMSYILSNENWIPLMK